MSHIYMTVAVIVHCQNHFLFVREYNSENILCYNQPSGHLEAGETPLAGAQRELWEETGLELPIDGWLGIYSYHLPQTQDTILRIAFVAQAPALLATHATNDPDQEIIDSLWMTPTQLLNIQDQLRSPMVLACVTDYLGGKFLDLSYLKHVLPEKTR